METVAEFALVHGAEIDRNTSGSRTERQKHEGRMCSTSTKKSAKNAQLEGKCWCTRVFYVDVSSRTSFSSESDLPGASNT